LTPDQIKQILIEKIMQEKQTEAVIDLEEEVHSRDDKFNVVSLFCGAGGLDLGFELAGLQVVIGEEEALKAFMCKKSYDEVRSKSIFHTIFANDFFKEALETYTLNNPGHIKVLNGDIRKVKRFPQANLVLGGFPCPGFSEAGPRLIDDERNFLYLQFIRCLTQSQPEIFVAENVKGMLTLGKGEVFRQIKEDFESVGYTVYPKLVNARDYGVPQHRERVFLIGVKNDSAIDFKYEFPEPSHGPGKKPYVTLWEAIGDLRSDPGPYYKGSFSSIYMSRNRKKRWDEQSFTIQASGRQAPLHPDGAPMRYVAKDKWEFTDGVENNRRLSVKEVRRIQTFPDWYEFYPKHIELNSHLDKIYKQIGNAVPVMLARAIALPIAKWAKSYLERKAAFEQKLEEIAK
jgi:DNA (cytosine-5)-methyltransferase 1